MPRCIVCGEKENTTVYKFPHGNINLCWGCRQQVYLKIEDSFPVVWLSTEDFEDREIMGVSNEEVAKLKKYLPDGADAFIEALWNDNTFSEIYSENLKYALETMENSKVRATKLKVLPLLLGTFKFTSSSDILEKRLKENK